MRPVSLGLAGPFALILPLLLAARVCAQGGPNITLQLPSFHSTGVNTTVLVPDSGPSPLARERQEFYSRTMYRGLTPQRTIGVDRRNAGVSATAQIHDARAADEALLRQARARRTNWTRGSTGREINQTLASDPSALRSVAELERERAAHVAAEQREAASFLAQARAARGAGKSSVAAVYYGMAARRAAKPERPKIEAEARAARSESSTR